MQVYVLIDPITLKVRYIGLTATSLEQRLGTHVCKAKHNYYPDRPKDKWIRSLLLHNCKPVPRRLCIVEGLKEGRKVERILITKYRDRLLNQNEAGIDGKNTVITEAMKQAISKTLKAKHAINSLKRPGSKTIYAYDRDGNFIDSYGSGFIAAKALDVAYSAIYKCTSGLQKHYRGFQFNLNKVETMKKIQKVQAKRERKVI